MIFNEDTGCYEYYLVSSGTWLSLCGDNPSQNQEKPRMIGYGGGVGHNSRVVLNNNYQDVDVRVTFSGSELFVELVDVNLQYRQTNLDWPTVTTSNSVVVSDNFLYLLMRSSISPAQWRVFRYDVNNIAAGGVQMNFVGLSLVDTNNEIMMTADDGGTFYFNHNAGSTTNDYLVAKYTLAGTNFNYLSSVAFGGTVNSFNRIMVDSSGDVYGISTALDDRVRKFNPTGGLIYVTSPYVLGTGTGRVTNWDDTFYFGDNSIDKILNRVYLE